jgi:translation initiation factor IF-1
MNSEKYIEVEGKIVSVLPGTMFRVELANGHQVLAHISGKLRKNFIKFTNGDMVRMEMTPKDITKARITHRLKVATVGGNGGGMRSTSSVRNFNPRR